MSSLSDKAELAPEVKSFFSGIGERVKAAASHIASKAEESAQAFPIVATVIFLVIAVGFLFWYAKKQRLFETVGNIKRITRADVYSFQHYEQSNQR